MYPLITMNCEHAHQYQVPCSNEEIWSETITFVVILPKQCQIHN